MSRYVKTANIIAKEAGFEGKDVYPAAFGTLSAAVQTFLWMADDCNDLEQLKHYVKTSFEKVAE